MQEDAGDQGMRLLADAFRPLRPGKDCDGKKGDGGQPMSAREECQRIGMLRGELRDNPAGRPEENENGRSQTVKHYGLSAPAKFARSRFLFLDAFMVKTEKLMVAVNFA